jgi:large subunit ribosomal protein L21
MYAVFQTGGKQFRAEPGVRLRIPSLDIEPGDSITFDHVLLAGDGEEKVLVGTPTVDGASVKAEVIRHGRADKIIVFKRKRRKGYRKKQGHRQNFTEIRIEEVALA